MGCMSSKLMSRTKSLQKLMSRRIQRSASSIPPLKELGISGSINSIVRTADSTAAAPAKLIRSKSCCSSSCTELAKRQNNDIALVNMKENSNPYRAVGRAWSFHTVEEYDALIEKLTKTNHSHQSHESNFATDINQGDIGQEIVQLSNPSDHYEEQSILSSSELHTSRSNIASPETEEEVNAAKDSNSLLQKGCKRRYIANGLGSLEIPRTTIEFPALANLGTGGQAYSTSGHLSYVTPKFGSYSLPPVSGTEKQGNERTIFNPELVAAFEECMQQLEKEAESILVQIAGNLEEESVSEIDQVGDSTGGRRPEYEASESTKVL